MLLLTTPNKVESVIIFEKWRILDTDAKIRVGDNSTDAFNKIMIKTLPDDSTSI